MEEKLYIKNNCTESELKQDCVLQVYDLLLRNFREIDTKKINENKNQAIVIFEYKALKVLEKHYIVCGFVVVDPIEHVIIPLDIHSGHICIFESQFNIFFSKHCFELKKYIITDKPAELFSRFFIQSQIAPNEKCFEENGSFVELCSMILNNSRIIYECVNKKISLYQPNTYTELCTMVQRITKLSEINWWKLDYMEKYKYLLDSLINRYRIKLTQDEIWVVWDQVCREVLKHWEVM